MAEVKRPGGSTRAYAIADMIKQGKQVVYVLVRLALSYIPGGTPTPYQWKLVGGKYVSAENIYKEIDADNKAVGDTKLKLINFKFDAKKMPVGDPASFDRFTVEENKGAGVAANDPRFKPWVVLSRITYNERTVAFNVIKRNEANGKLVVKREVASKVNEYGEKFTQRGLVPIQNMRYMKDSKSFAAYPHSEIFEEKGVVANNVKRNIDNEPKMTQEEVTKQNEKVKLSDIYTKGQLKELKLGKDHGVNIKTYMNKELSAEQMGALRKGLEANVDVRPFANPDIDVDVMKYCITDMQNGLNIAELSNVYNKLKDFDLGQIAEISLAYELGLDISKIAKPELKANEMSSIIVAMREHMWQDEGQDVIIEGQPFVDKTPKKK